MEGGKAVRMEGGGIRCKGERGGWDLIGRGEDGWREGIGWGRGRGRELGWRRGRGRFRV